MRTLHTSFLTLLALAAVGSPVGAASISVATVPEGILTYTVPASGAKDIATYFSLPLTEDPVYSGAISSLSTTSLTVSGSPWTSGELASASDPYFVKVLSGVEAGRVVKVTSNTTTSVTLDTNDNTSHSTVFTTSGFAVKDGDTFEVFPGDTLASVFGLDTSSAPLIFKGSTSSTTADLVGVYSTQTSKWQDYYFDTHSKFWKAVGATTDAGDTVIYPYASIRITRRASQSSLTFALTGRVSSVAHLTKNKGNGAVVYDSTGFPINITFSQLSLGSSWVKSTSSSAADNLGVWNQGTQQWNTYYQSTDSKWHLVGSTLDKSNTSLPSGVGISLLQRGSVNNATSFLTSTLPYSLN